MRTTFPTAVLRALRELVKLRWRWLAARDVHALHDIGAWYGSGDVPWVAAERGERIAFRYYQRAAALGDAESKYELCFYCLEGRAGYCPKDMGAARRLVGEAAEGGCVAATDLAGEFDSLYGGSDDRDRSGGMDGKGHGEP